MLLHHIFKTNVNEEEELKKGGDKVVLAVKQWPFKAFGGFQKINCMNKYLLTDSVFIFVGNK